MNVSFDLMTTELRRWELERAQGIPYWAIKNDENCAHDYHYQISSSSSAASDETAVAPLWCSRVAHEMKAYKSFMQHREIMTRWIETHSDCDTTDSQLESLLDEDWSEETKELRIPTPSFSPRASISIKHSASPTGRFFKRLHRFIAPRFRCKRQRLE